MDKLNCWLLTDFRRVAEGLAFSYTLIIGDLKYQGLKK